MKPMETAVELTPTVGSSSTFSRSLRLKPRHADLRNVTDDDEGSHTSDPELVDDSTTNVRENEIIPESPSSNNMLYRFFYPKRRKTPDFYDPQQHRVPEQDLHDESFVDSFWTTFDDFLMLSIFTQVGIVSRLAASTWFAKFDDVFSHESALFVNLPLNCLSCLVMGLLCSGSELMHIVRLSPPSPAITKPEASALDEEERMSSKHYLHKRRNNRHRRSNLDPTEDIHNELREVQLKALERRIRASKSLLLFPVSKKDIDVMEHYDHRNHDLALTLNIADEEMMMNDEALQEARFRTRNSPHHENAEDRRYGNVQEKEQSPASPVVDPLRRSNDSSKPNSESNASNPPPDSNDESSSSSPDLITEFTTNVQENVVENIETFARVNRKNLLLRGWVKGTTPEEMSDDLLLGLRDGFCGAISSFSSWNSSMVNLLKHGQITEALVGYMIGIQLPIIAYRFGQHIALYLFVWKTRREARSAERRGGYAIRVSIDEESDHTKQKVKEIPSLRAVFFALFILALSLQITSIYLFRDPDDQQLALSLLFSPLGALARWRLGRLNHWRPGFPLGTFIANLLACALAGSLGTLLAGNPGPRERIALVSIIAGFGGTLSSLATFIVQILAGVDPILLRFDGAIYAAVSIGGAMVIAFASSSSVEWVDETVAANAAGAAASEALSPNDDDMLNNRTSANGTGLLLF